MHRKFLTLLILILISASAASAQEKTKYQRYNRWMAGLSFTKDNRNSLGYGIRAVYGRQFSEIIFLGVGFGADHMLENISEMSMTFTDENGNQTYREYGSYRHNILMPVYADLMVDFGRLPASFFAEFKVGAALDASFQRISGTERYTEADFSGGGILLGSGVGKHFSLKNDDNLDILISIDCILGPFYANVPISIGIRYGF